MSWSEEDQDLALEYTLERKITCEQCGTRADEWQEDDTAYLPWEERCRGCVVKRNAEKALSDKNVEDVRVYLLPANTVMELEAQLEEKRKTKRRRRPTPLPEKTQLPTGML